MLSNIPAWLGQHQMASLSFTQYISPSCWSSNPQLNSDSNNNPSVVDKSLNYSLELTPTSLPVTTAVLILQKNTNRPVTVIHHRTSKYTPVKVKSSLRSSSAVLPRER